MTLPEMWGCAVLHGGACRAVLEGRIRCLCHGGSADPALKIATPPSGHLLKNFIPETGEPAAANLGYGYRLQAAAAPAGAPLNTFNS